MIRLEVCSEEWPLARAFRISRGSKTSARVVVATLTDDGARGHGECLPYTRYGESVEQVADDLRALEGALREGATRADLASLLPPGAARNALDCALVDLECKRRGRRAWEILDCEPPRPVVTAYTLGIDTPERMGQQAREQSHRGLIKVKLGPEEAAECIREVRAGAPASRLIVDANEGWNIDQLESAMAAFVDCGVELIEQPLAAGSDHDLADFDSPIPLGADESCHTADDVDALADRYRVLNIKLDKTGGVSGALALRRRARERGLDVMVGCMLATSLSMAPAMLVTPGARYVDLDGPLLLSRDRSPGLVYQGDRVLPPDAALWG